VRDSSGNPLDVLTVLSGANGGVGLLGPVLPRANVFLIRSTNTARRLALRHLPTTIR
jgi:hypothetical protein